MIHDTSAYPAPVADQTDRLHDVAWDCLCVFDAARWDALDAVWPYEVEPVRSPALGTPDWLDSLWFRDDTPGGDVTYVMGNPWGAGPKSERSLADFVDVVPGYDLAWDDVLGTTRPEKLTDLALDADPPVVVHYLQPHNPFIGELSVRAKPCSTDDRAHAGHSHDAIPDWERGEPAVPVYRMARAGQIDLGLVREAYLDNLRLVVDAAERLTTAFDRVVFTSDHGEHLGPERFGHNIGTPQVETVPWWASL